MVSVKVDLKKRDLIWVGLFVVLLGVGFVVAWGGTQPNVMGHSLGELDLPSCTSGQVLAKTSTGWGCVDAAAASGGDITSVTAGTGLSGGGTTGAVTINAETSYLQRRISEICTGGSAISAIDSTGGVTCVGLPLTLCTYSGVTYSEGARCTIKMGTAQSKYLDCQSDGSWIERTVGYMIYDPWCGS